MEKLGIVIPYINCARYVTKAVMSIETKEPYVLVMVDNNSTPKTKSFLKYLEKRKNTKVLYNDINIGCPASWNLGIKTCFQYMFVERVLVLNNDVILHPECIDRLIEKQKETAHPIITGRDVAAECATPTEVRALKIPDREFVVDEPEFSCFMVSRFGFRDIGSFDEKFFPAYFEDNDYHYRARLQKKRMVKLNTAMYYHFGSRTIRSSAEMQDIVNAYYLQNEQYFVEKWGGKPGSEKYKEPFDGRR